MTQTHLKVVRVVRRRDFNRTGTEIFIDIFIRNNRNFTVDKRKNEHFSHKIFISFVVRVNRNGSIAEKCFGTCCGNYNIFAAILNRIFYMPEMTVLLGIFNLSVRQSRCAVRTPVYNSRTLVNKTFIIKIDKNLTYRL